MKRFLSVLLSAALLAALLSGCAAQPEDAVSLKPTAAVEPTATGTPAQNADAPSAVVDIDFSQANEALQVPIYWKNSPHRVLKSLLTIPSTTPIEIAHGLDNMNGVVYVGTDGEGREYLAIFNTVERTCEKVYTAETGIKIVSIAENVSHPNGDIAGAYCWIETDGDQWRILCNDDSGDPSICAEGSLSEGSAFIPTYAEDILSEEWKLALISPADATEQPYLFRGGEQPIAIDSSILSANDLPIFAIGVGQFIHTELVDGQEYFVFHDLYEESCTSTPFAQFSYRLSGEEKLTQIVDGTHNFMGNTDLCLLTDAGNCYGYVTEDDTPYLVLKNVTQAIGSRIDCTFLLTQEGDKLYTWNGVVGDVPLYYNENAKLTGLAEGYVSEANDAPYEVFVFSDEQESQFIYAVEFEAYPRGDE